MKTEKTAEHQIKNICLKFFYWWYNSKGSNTEQGFDEWARSEGKPLIEQIYALTGHAINVPTSLSSPKQEIEQKPDFFQIVAGKYIHSIKAAHSRIPIQSVNERESRAYVAGCEKIWNDYVSPLQARIKALEQENNNLKDDLEFQGVHSDNDIAILNARIKELEQSPSQK